MTRHLTIAIALLLGACNQHRAPEPANDQAENQQAEAKAAGVREAQQAVELTRIDTLESRVTRLEAEVAEMEARHGSVDDLKNAMAQLNAQQAVPAPRSAQDKPSPPKPAAGLPDAP